MNFEFLLAGGFHTIFHLWEDHDKAILLTDALEIHFIDMVKFRMLREKDIANDPLHRWLTYFDKDSPPELVEEVVRMDAAILKAQERAAIVAGDKEALREIHLREMGLSDWTSGVNHARREGIREGMREGSAKTAREIFDLWNKGKTIEEAKKIFGLE